MVRMYELEPVYGQSQASFYGKAHVVSDLLGNHFLYSYLTAVAVIDNGGNFHRLWEGWSATTGKHIRAFCVDRNVPVIGKADWDKLEVEFNWVNPING